MTRTLSHQIRKDLFMVSGNCTLVSQVRDSRSWGGFGIIISRYFRSEYFPLLYPLGLILIEVFTFDSFYSDYHLTTSY